MAWNFVALDYESVLDPAPLLEAAQRNNSQTDFIGRANSITCPLGINPGSAWLLVPRSVVDGSDALDRNELYDIVWTATLANTYDVGDGEETVFFDYVIASAVCVAIDGDEKGAYLLELRDIRQLLFESTANKNYNVSYRTTTGDKQYFEHTTNSGTPWTWEDIFNDLWDALPTAIAGAAPELPYVPSFVPDTIRFVGVSAWEAIGEVLAFLCCAIKFDPMTGEFSVASLNDPQDGLASAISDLASRKILDYKPKGDCKLAIVPETFSFVFPRRTIGEPKQVDNGWVVELPSGIDGAQEGTKLPIPMPFVAEFETIASTTPDNTSDCDLAAFEMSYAVAAKITQQFSSYDLHYAGLDTTILPGCQIHVSRWYARGDDDGLRTNHYSTDDYLLPAGLIIEPWRPVGGSGDPIIRFEILAAADCPGTVTDNRLPLGGGCWAKQLRRITTSDNFETFGDAFWVNDFRKDQDGDPIPGEYIAAPGYRGVATLVEQVDDPESEGGTMPEWSIVEVEHIAEVIEGTLTEDMSHTTSGQSNSATVTRYFDGKNPGSTQNVFDPQGLFKRALSGAKFKAFRNNKLGDGDPESVSTLPKGRYELVECESKAGWVNVTIGADRSGTSTQEVTATIVKYGGTQQDIQQPTDSTFHVNFYANTYTKAKSGSNATAIYDNVNDKYWIIDCEDRVAKTFITQWRWDAATMSAQVKTLEVLVTPNGTESGWTTVYTGTEC